MALKILWNRFFAAAAVLTVCLSNPARSQILDGGDRPNILVIIADDHNASAMNPEMTPNLMRLARRGVTFRRAYCNSPLARPSRYSLLTGRLPHSIGVTRAHSRLASDEITIARLLTHHERSLLAHAYGSLYLRREDVPQMEGFIALGFTSGWTLQDALDDYFRDPRNRFPPRIAPNVKIASPWLPFADAPEDWLNTENRPFGAAFEQISSTRYARKAAAFMSEPRRGPFLLFVGFSQPHSPFEYPVDFEPRFAPDDFDLPELGPNDAAQIPLVFRGLAEAERKNILAAYATATAYLDRCVGILLEGLREAGIEDDTIVIYTSDSGYSLGQNGWFEKNRVAESVTRVPLIISWPDRFGEDVQSDALVELIDLYPTLADVYDAPMAPRVEGRSLVPLLTGESDAGREAVFSEYLENEEAMVFDGRFKLIYTTGKRKRADGFIVSHDEPEKSVRLYDLLEDPEEHQDLFGDPQFADRVAALKEEMLRRFLVSKPEGLMLEEGATIDDQLDIFLVPRETWRDVMGLIKL